MHLVLTGHMRAFVRQTINLGVESEKVDAGINQFADWRTANRTDFMNWSLINAGTFDIAGDAWEYTYGAAVEWYQGSWTLRGGFFDLSANALMPNFSNPARRLIVPGLLLC